MPVYRPPALDKAAPIVDVVTGRPSPYMQRFWQNLSFTAADGANQVADVSTLTAQMPTKAPLANPTFTGVQTGTTAPQGTNSTRLATTGFVHAEAVARATFAPWAAATGTATRTTFDTNTVTLSQLAERVKALIDDLKT
jgi:hypothetical protein